MQDGQNIVKSIQRKVKASKKGINLQVLEQIDQDINATLRSYNKKQEEGMRESVVSSFRISIPNAALMRSGDETEKVMVRGIITE